MRFFYTKYMQLQENDTHITWISDFSSITERWYTVLKYYYSKDRFYKGRTWAWDPWEIDYIFFLKRLFEDFFIYAESHKIVNLVTLRQEINTALSLLRSGDMKIIYPHLQWMFIHKFIQTEGVKEQLRNIQARANGQLQKTPPPLSRSSHTSR